MGVVIIQSKKVLISIVNTGMNRLVVIDDASASVIWPEIKSYFDPKHRMFLSLRGFILLGALTIASFL